MVVRVIGRFHIEKLKVTPRGGLDALIGGGTIGLLSRIPNLDIPLKEAPGIIGLGVGAFLLLAVSFLDLEGAALRGAR